MNTNAKNNINETIKRRQRKQQAVFLEQLQKVPIILMACSKAGISRATYYRWRDNYVDFAKSVDETMPSGIEQVNDMAEAVIISAIKNGSLRASEFWLKNNKTNYNAHPNIQINVEREQARKVIEETQEVLRKFMEPDKNTRRLGRAIRNLSKKPKK